MKTLYVILFYFVFINYTCLPMICNELPAAGKTSSKEYVELIDNIIDLAKLFSVSTRVGPSHIHNLFSNIISEL